MTELEYSSVEIIITTGDQVRRITARRAKDLRVKTDMDLDPDITLQGDGGVIARFLGDDEMEVDFTFTALRHPDTDAIMQESRQP